MFACRDPICAMNMTGCYLILSCFSTREFQKYVSHHGYLWALPDLHHTPSCLSQRNQARKASQAEYNISYIEEDSFDDDFTPQCTRQRKERLKRQRKHAKDRHRRGKHAAKSARVNTHSCSCLLALSHALNVYCVQKPIMFHVVIFGAAHYHC